MLAQNNIRYGANPCKLCVGGCADDKPIEVTEENVRKLIKCLAGYKG